MPRRLGTTFHPFIGIKEIPDKDYIHIYSHLSTVSALNKKSFQTREQGLARLEFLNPASKWGRISYRSSSFLCSLSCWKCWRRGGGAGGALQPLGLLCAAKGGIQPLQPSSPLCGVAAELERLTGCFRFKVGPGEAPESLLRTQSKHKGRRGWRGWSLSNLSSPSSSTAPNFSSLPPSNRTQSKRKPPAPLQALQPLLCVV